MFSLVGLWLDLTAGGLSPVPAWRYTDDDYTRNVGLTVPLPTRTLVP